MAFVTAAVTDPCTVTLTAASSNAQTVTLSSDNPAVIVPAATTVPTQSASAGFTATVAAVSSAQTATLTATASGASKTFTLRLSASAVATPALTTSTNTIAFGNVAVNTTAAHAVTVTSSGTGTLTISGAAVSGAAFSLSGPTLPLALNPGQSATFYVAFDPQSTGSASGALRLTSNASAGSTTSIALSGTGTSTSVPTQAALTVSATSISFGSVAVNTAASPQNVTLTSSGTAALTISSAAVAGAAFSVSGASFPVSLNPGQSVTLTVYFDPSTAGALSGSLTVSSNAASGGTTAILLSGTGTTTGGSSGAPALISPAPGSVLGGSSVVFTWSTVASVTAYQLWLGTAALGSGNIAVYSFGATSAPTISATVTGIPVSGGKLYARLFTYTAATGAWQTSDYTYIEASGAGQSTTSGLTLSAASLDFGNVGLNSPITQTVKLTATGSTAVTISGASLTGTEFSISGISFPAVLSPGQTATLNVAFDPAAAGAVTGTLTLVNSASGTATVALSGTGQAVAYQVNLSWDAPVTYSDPWPVAGYRIYRAVYGSSSWQLLNSVPDSGTTYTDSNVMSGKTYSYQVATVDAAGNQSAPSGAISLAVP